MGHEEIEGFLAILANKRRVAASTHKQALSALLFLYREVLGVHLPWLDGVQRTRTPKRIPSVLTVAKVNTAVGATARHGSAIPSSVWHWHAFD